MDLYNKSVKQARLAAGGNIHVFRTKLRQLSKKFKQQSIRGGASAGGSGATSSPPQKKARKQYTKPPHIKCALCADDRTPNSTIRYLLIHPRKGFVRKIKEVLLAF